MDDTQPQSHNPHARENVGHPTGRSLLFIGAIIALVLFALLIVGIIPHQRQVRAADSAAKAERDSLPAVLVAPARRAPAMTELLLPGNITPLIEASIYARSSGYLRRRMVDIGDRVKAGQLLATIEAPDLDQQVAQARAAVAQADQQLAQAQATLQQGKAQLELARITRDRYAILVKKGALSRQDGDNQETNYQTSDATVGAYAASVHAAEENVRVARANLDRLLALQGYEQVTAPFAGVITARLVDQGYFISSSGAGSGPAPTGFGGSTPGATTGASGGGELFRLAQIGAMRILLNVPQTDAPGIHVGQDADVLLAEFPGHTFAGHVTRTANSLDINSRTLLTEVQVPNPQSTLLPGMFANVRLRSPRPSPPVLIPGDAVIAGNDGLYVAILRDGNRIHIQRIEEGRDNGVQVEVISGLQGWEYVVVNPSDVVREGVQVRPAAAQVKGPATK
jgi:multidrug efflux pump subunit AcrA (membrane-fusion protein)